jgi:tyrosine-protein phosphatase SIW14
MKMNRRVFSQRISEVVLVSLLICTMSLPAWGGTADRSAVSRSASLNIKNFGKVNDHIFRGGQPEGDDYRQLFEFGIKTVVDLRADSEPGARAAAEQAGLHYISLPMAPKSYPQADAARRFLEIVNDRTNGPFYVHCAGGRHRTGAMLAVYRMEMDGWDVERAYQEMKDYDFYTRFGHGCYKDFVYQYSRGLRDRSTEVSGNHQNSSRGRTGVER